MQPFESPDNLTEDVGLFQAAVHARPVEIATPNLAQIVVALDGSNQDVTARALAGTLGTATGAAVHEHTGAAAAADILRVCAERRADLLVVPVPFGRDIGVLKDESLGSVVDMLLLEATCPVLCVRALLDEGGVQAALAGVILPVDITGAGNARAAGWAFRVVRPGGRLELIGVADRDVLEESRALLGEHIDPAALEAEALNRAVTQDIAGLIAAVQRRGAAERLTVHVVVKMGRPVHVILEEANARPRLIVVAATKVHSAPDYHRALDLVLGAKGPVLVV